MIFQNDAPFFHDGSIKTELKRINIDIIHENIDFFTWEPAIMNGLLQSSTRY